MCCFFSIRSPIYLCNSSWGIYSYIIGNTDFAWTRHLGLLLHWGADTFLALCLCVDWKKGLGAALGGGAHHVVVRQGHFW